MIGVKEAVQKATAFIENLYPQAKDIRLEEIEPMSTEHSSEWNVVVSFKTGEPTTLSSVMGGESRLFKTVLMSQVGEPYAVKIWKN